MAQNEAPSSTEGEDAAGDTVQLGEVDMEKKVSDCEVDCFIVPTCATWSSAEAYGIGCC